MKNFYLSLYSIKQLLSNFEPQKGGKTKQLPGLEKSQVAYKKKKCICISIIFGHQYGHLQFSNPVTKAITSHSWIGNMVLKILTFIS